MTAYAYKDDPSISHQECSCPICKAPEQGYRIEDLDTGYTVEFPCHICLGEGWDDCTDAQQ